MVLVGKLIQWLGYLMLIACSLLFVNYFLFGVRPVDGEVDFWRGPVLPFFLLMAGILTAFTGLMIKGAFGGKE